MSKNSSIRRIIQGKTKPLFLLIHMNGCGWCERVKPDWKKVVDHFKSSPIAVMDIETNELTDRDMVGTIDGFPTIKYIYQNDIQEYKDADRSSDALIQWINTLTSSIQKGGRKRTRKHQTRKVTTKQKRRRTNRKRRGSRKRRRQR